jgi:hypothetical protein
MSAFNYEGIQLLAAKSKNLYNMGKRVRRLFERKNMGFLGLLSCGLERSFFE